MSNVRHPEVKVRLVGEDGNAFAILGRVTKALRRENVSAAEIKEFTAEATSGDYDHLLRTVMAWVEDASMSEDETEEVDDEDANYNYDEEEEFA